MTFLSTIKSSVENQQSIEVPSLMNIPWFLNKEVLFRMVSCQTANMRSQKYRQQHTAFFVVKHLYSSYVNVPKELLNPHVTEDLMSIKYS
jgi:hypothetical protein